MRLCCNHTKLWKLTNLCLVSSAEGIKKGLASGLRCDSTRIGLGGGGGSLCSTGSSIWDSDSRCSRRIFWNSSRLIMSTDLKLEGWPGPSSISSWVKVWWLLVTRQQHFSKCFTNRSRDNECDYRFDSWPCSFFRHSREVQMVGYWNMRACC